MLSRARGGAMTPHPQQDDHIDDLDRLAGWIRFQIENRQAHNAFCKESRRTYRKVLKQIDALHLERTRCCASHSSAPSEQEIREKVLNKAWSLMCDEKDTNHCVHISMVWKVIEKLRSKQDGEQG